MYSYLWDTTLGECRMTFADILRLGIGEDLLVTIIPVFLACSGLRKGLARGLKEFRKATQEVQDELAEALATSTDEKRESVAHDFVIILILISGVGFLMLLLRQIFAS